MHDIDRTQLEFGAAMESFEFNGEAGVFSEGEMMELATGLLEVTSDQELDQFLGGLLSKAGRAFGQFVRSPTGQALGGLLRGAAKKVLPMAGQALGGYLGGSSGAQAGGQLASAIGSRLGLEAEGVDPELDAATRFVRMAGEAVKNAAQAPAGMNPRAAAAAALTQAAKIYAPALVAATTPAIQGTLAGIGTGSARTGRWLRRGNKIILYGV